MKKTIYITITVIIGIIAVAGYLRFVVGGDEDTWLCDNGQWVKHGVPSAPMPTSGCGDEDTWICDGSQWVKHGNPTQQKPPLEQCGDIIPGPEDEIQIPIEWDQYNWSTMNEGPYRDKITYALSNDLINWNPSRVILAEHASVPGAVMKDGTIFVYFVDVSTNGIKEQLGMVKSTDEGATWSEPTTLTIEGLGNKATADPAAVVTDDGQIRLYYFDINEPRLSNLVVEDEFTNKIYSAISDDGINFTQESGVRLEYPGAFDPDVLYADGTWYMYTGDLKGNKVNVATSTDGLTFTHQGTAYQGGAVPDVWHENGSWYLYTAGINIATSSDGLTFTDSLNRFSDPNFMVTADPSVVQLSNEFYLMLYKVQK